MVQELLAYNLKKYRKDAGLTQNAFAELCGVSSSFIAHVETMSCNVSIGFIEKVCRVLNIEPAGLLANKPAGGKAKDFPLS